MKSEEVAATPVARADEAATLSRQVVSRILAGDALPAGAREAGFALRRVVVAPDAMHALDAWLKERGLRSALLVADERTRLAAVEAVVGATARAGCSSRLHLLTEAPGREPSADAGEVERATEAVVTAGPDVVIAVGAGTVTDVGKMAATRAARPWISVPTAPSMNGFTSGIAAILEGGVKRTLPAAQTEAVFADPAVLAAAPHRLVAAGFADLSSKPFSDACWRLSSVMAGVPYDAAASALLDAPFRALTAAAAAVGRRESDAMEALALTLVVSGCSMAIAGSSAPASGGEHLLSHYWDMVEHAAHRPVRALHGLQVGVATRLSAKLYRRALDLPIAQLASDEAALARLLAAHPASAEELEARVRARHPGLPPDVLDGVVAQSRQKYVSREGLRDRLVALSGRWPALRGELAASVASPEEVEGWLEGARAPVLATALGVDDATLAHTVRWCRDIRARYTVLDFSAELGILEPFARELEQGR